MANYRLRIGPSSLPAWLSGVAVNEVVAIPGTDGAGGAAVDAFNGWAYRASTREIYIAAAGGHSDSSDNRVVSLNLNADSPAWGVRAADPPAALDGRASEAGDVVEDATHYADGRPSSRHLYHYLRWSETQNRVMLMGCYAPFGGSVTTRNSVDGFNPDTNLWDAAGTFDDITAGRYGNAHQATDTWALWESSQSRFWTASTAAWSNPSVSYSSTWIRFPWAWDSSRSQLFGLAIGDSQGSGTDLRAIRHAGTTQTDITLNSISGALAQFESDAGEYPGMDCDEANDCFLWYDGRSTRAGRFYKITPNSGTIWDIEIISVTGDAVPATPSSGINSRFSYVDFGGVKGFVFMPSSAAGCYFLRTA